MAIITAIEVQKKDKNRSNIYIDGAFFAGLQNEVVVLNSLKSGIEIDEDELKNLIIESDKIVAFNKALLLLNKRFKTQSEIRKYLKEKGYLEEVIEIVIDKLKEYHYIDDEHYASAYISANLHNKSKMFLEKALKEKGVAQSIIDKNLENIESECDNIKTLYKKYMKNKEDTFENRQKAYRYLSSKGYKWDDIKSSICIQDE